MGSKPGLSSALPAWPERDITDANYSSTCQGQTFPRSRLTAIYPTPIESKRGPIRGWVCVCECGWLTTVSTTSLLWGATRSCGCLQKEIAQESMRQVCRAGHGERPARRWHGPGRVGAGVLRRHPAPPGGEGERLTWTSPGPRL